MAKYTATVISNRGTTDPHPPYIEMITEAISTLKDQTGSSQQAIAKFIDEKYGKVLPPNFKKVLSTQLKKFVISERLVKVKNSFKLSSNEKHTKKKKKKKKNDVANAASMPKEKTSVKKVSGKKVRTKRLSQVKTPEGMKKATKDSEKKKTTGNGKMKLLNQVKTPDGLKKNLTPMKRKSAAAKPVGSSRPTKKTRN